MPDQIDLDSFRELKRQLAGLLAGQPIPPADSMYYGPGLMRQFFAAWGHALNVDAGPILRFLSRPHYQNVRDRDADAIEAETALHKLAAAVAREAGEAVAATPEGMTWETAKAKGEDHCRRNPWPGVNALAKILGCSTATLRKAVDRSPVLRARRAEHDAQRKSVSAGAITGAVTDGTAQTREPDVIDAASKRVDGAFQRLLQQATPTERAKLNAMTPAKRLELVNTLECDPDAGQRVRGK